MIALMKLPRVLACLLLLILCVTPAHAGGRRKKEPEHYDTVISAVTPSAITISENKETKTFTITQFTEVDFKGQRVTAAELKPGMLVTVTIAADGASASRINANDPPVHNEHDKKTVRPPRGWMK